LKKVLPYLGASLAAIALAWSIPASAQDAFKDLDTNHWAYKAVTELQEKKILEGYPDGYFRGKRTLTRYEFAVALKRALDNLPTGTGGTAGPKGDTGETGPKGDKGDKGDPGLTPDELARLMALTNEFRNELASLGANVRDINNRLEGLSKDVAALKKRMNEMIQWGGGFFVGARTDRSRFGFVDYSGATRQASSTHFGRADVLHAVNLEAKANLRGDVKFTGNLVATNYFAYRGNTLNTASVANQAIGGPAGGGSGNSLATDFIPYQAQLDIPIGGFGSNTVLTVGRYLHSLTPLTYYRPDTDAYFDVPLFDDGNYAQDGVRLSSKFGSATTSIWAASFATPTLQGGASFNQPLIGGIGQQQRLLGGNLQAGINRPFGINTIGQNVAANQTAGIKIAVPLFGLGELGVSATTFSLNGDAATTLAPNQNAPGAAAPFSNVVVYGANFTLKKSGRFALNAEVAKSVTQRSFDQGDGQSNDDNNAFLVTAGYDSGPIKIEAGYQYYDPRFGAPGFWNKIGSWYNPTNVKGPFARVNYKLSNKIGLYFGGDLLEGARNRPGYLTIGDNINRVNAGAKFNLSSKFNVGVDYEGVFYDLTGGTSGTFGGARPQEQYLTINAGLNLATNTALKLGYQIISVDNFSGGFTNTGFGAAGNGGGVATVFTTQLAVKF